MVRKTIPLIVVLGCTALAVALLYKRDGNPPVSPEAKLVEAQAVEPGHTSTKNWRAIGLPSLSSPLRESLPRLRELAAQGHPGAQCRLASEFQRCLTARQQLAFSESYVRRATASVADAGAGMSVFGQSGLESDLKHCDEVEGFDAVEVASLWRLSAESGHREGMLRYSVGAAFDMGHIVDLAQEISTYKRKALPTARRAAAAGDGRALIALASAYSPDSHIGAPNMLAQVAGEDVVQSLGMFMFAERKGIRPEHNREGLDIFMSGRIANLRAAASADQTRLAEELAAKLAADWSAPVLPSGDERNLLVNAQYTPAAPEACMP